MARVVFESEVISHHARMVYSSDVQAGPVGIRPQQFRVSRLVKPSSGLYQLSFLQCNETFVLVIYRAQSKNPCLKSKKHFFPRVRSHL